MPDANRRVGEGGTALARLIDHEIASTGPMGLARYMALCLTHPEYGYYVRGAPLGAAGDFITAPEISQLFGEMVGVWIVIKWQGLGRPRRWTLGEAGPGRGTLMADAMRVVTRAGGRPEVVLLETNASLRAEQKARLEPFSPRWANDLTDFVAGEIPLIVVANEFFDALPIAQYQRVNNGWRERLIGLRNGQRCWGLSSVPIGNKALPQALAGATPGDIFEQGSPGKSMMGELAMAISGRGGGALVIDYGHEKTTTGDSLQAVSGHAPCDPLLRPGEVDLTAHVDFEALANAARAGGAEPLPLLTQGYFLAQMGIKTRTGALVAANPARASELNSGLERLTGPSQMGELFKVLEISESGPR
jgi:NADH dehydrogenase [ubiquinone] 1 alpha subcomplex assembly factor 7